MWTSQFRKVKNSEKGTHFGDCKIENQQFWGKHTVKDNKSLKIMFILFGLLMSLLRIQPKEII